MSNTLTKNLVLSQPKAGHTESVHTPALSHTVSTKEDFTVVRVEIPGVDPSTVDVKCENNFLRIECERGDLTIPVDATVDFSAIEADILWGLLTVKIPQPAAPVSHNIKVSIHDTIKKSPAKTEKFTENE